jgi:MFS family permease
MQAWAIPGVPVYVFGYTCIKAVNYGILFWLADYLKDKGLDSDASVILIMNEIGQFLGGTLLGSLNDRTGKKALFLPFFLIGASLFFFLIKYVAY